MSMLFSLFSIPVPFHCGETVHLGSYYVGEVTLDARNLPAFNCAATIMTESENRLHFRVTGLKECTSQLHKPLLTIRSNSTYWENNKKLFCFYGTNSEYSDSYIDAGVNSILIEPKFGRIINSLSLKAVIKFYRTSLGNCDYEEVICNGCMHRELACDPSGEYCDYEARGLCQDITKDPTAQSGLIVGITFAIIILVLLVIICIWCHRNKLPCCKSDDDEEQRESIAARARNIFTVQLATRGVNSSGTGNENEAYADDNERIDPSLAQPPPEYSSLENIDEIGKAVITREEEDMPPSYDDAIENQAKYDVVDDSDYQR